MSKILAIAGAGHLGQQIGYYAIADNHYDKVVFFDDFTSSRTQNGVVLGNINSVEDEFKNKSFDEIIIAFGYNHMEAKKELFEKIKGKIPFGKMIHSSSYVDKSAWVEEGCVIYPTCAIDTNSLIEANTILNIGCTIAHNTTVGKHCFISPRVALAGFIKIEELCFVGINSTIIDNVTITAKTKIGGGSVVIKDINNTGLYVGNPIRFIR